MKVSRSLAKVSDRRRLWCILSVRCIRIRETPPKLFDEGLTNEISRSRAKSREGLSDRRRLWCMLSVLERRQTGRVCTKVYIYLRPPRDFMRPSSNILGGGFKIVNRFVVSILKKIELESTLLTVPDPLLEWTTRISIYSFVLTHSPARFDLERASTSSKIA
jgi:hypothetical protein